MLVKHWGTKVFQPLKGIYHVSTDTAYYTGTHTPTLNAPWLHDFQYSGT